MPNNPTLADQIERHPGVSLLLLAGGAFAVYALAGGGRVRSYSLVPSGTVPHDLPTGQPSAPGTTLPATTSAPGDTGTGGASGPGGDYLQGVPPPLSALASRIGANQSAPNSLAQIKPQAYSLGAVLLPAHGALSVSGSRLSQISQTMNLGNM